MRNLTILILFAVSGCGSADSYSRPDWATKPLVDQETTAASAATVEVTPHPFLDNFENYLPSPPADKIAQEKDKVSCASGDEVACMSVAARLYLGLGVTQDPKQALEWFGRACDGGHEEGCSWAGALYYRGEGIERDAAAALRWFEAGCKASNEEDCSRAASMYSRGDGHRQDAMMTRQFLQKGCELGYSELCDDFHKERSVLDPDYEDESE